MFDPYYRDTPGQTDPAKTMFAITPSDTNDLPIGIKALRIFNPGDATATLTVVTMLNEQIAFPVPPKTLWTEPLRVVRVLQTGTTAGLVLHGYTDKSVPGATIVQTGEDANNA